MDIAPLPVGSMLNASQSSRFSNLSPDEYNQLFETTPIEKVMAEEPGIVTPETPIHEVVQLMCEQKFGSVLVVDGENKLVGIVTTTDLLGVLHDLLGAS